MLYFSKTTCITFIEAEPPRYVKQIKFLDDDDGCGTYIGWPGITPISLESGIGCFQKAVSYY
jgi:hypothetical protein